MEALMTKKTIQKVFNALASNHCIIRKSLLYDWQKNPNFEPSHAECQLPDDADTLRPDNPKLKELERRYAAFNKSVTAPLFWTPDLITPEQIQFFRGDNAYVWQIRGKMQESAYALATYYIKSQDSRGLLDKLEEDGDFGVITFNVAEKTISRDLLDSINEIYFLDRHFNLFSNPYTILDIGAGYGRLAHRMCCVQPDVNYFCTDAFAVSTFLCDYYLKYRCLDKARSIPLDVIESEIQKNPPDLAINIHSWTECQPEAVNWWVNLLASNNVKNLFFVPNRTLIKETLAVIETRYKCVVKEPKYLDPLVQEYGVNPTDYYLFIPR
jgi:putative sugar O-methyltransferase